jgi:hypothetical protein
VTSDIYKIGLYGQSLFNTSDQDKNHEDATLIGSSGFNTVFLFTIHIDENGDFGYGNNPIFFGNELSPQLQLMPELLKILRAGTVETVLFSIGSADVQDWHHIKEQWNDPIRKQKLLDKFALLTTLLDLDGFDFDLEEEPIDDFTKVIVELTESLSVLGKGIVTYCPYRAPDFWLNCLSLVYGRSHRQLVHWINLQVYGGADAKQWIHEIQHYPRPLGISDADGFVVPGYDAGSGPAAITGWLSLLPVKGAFIWNAEGTLKAPGGPKTFAQAISDGLNKGS